MEIFLQLVLATLLGGLIGLEREYNKKEAGLRTFALVSLGAAFFTIIAYNSVGIFFEKPPVGFDPTRIIGQIVLGIGFIGAGLIVYRESHVAGLTTAAGLWVSAAIGAAVGIKSYLPAVFVAVLVILVLTGFRTIEEKLIKSRLDKENRK